MLFISNKRLPH